MADFPDIVNVLGTAPQLTLTDTDPGAKSLRIDVNNNVAQIRELNGVDYSFITLRFANPTATPPKANRLGIFSDATHENFRVQLGGTLDPAIDTANMFVAIGAQGNRPDWVEALYLDVSAIGTAVPPIRVDSLRALECVLWTGTGTTTNVTTAHMLTGVIWMSGSGVLTNAHAISIPAPSGNITNSIAVRIARDPDPRTRKYGFYYGTHAVGSEPSGSLLFMQLMIIVSLAAMLV